MVSDSPLASPLLFKRETANAIFWTEKWKNDASRLFAAGTDEAEIWDYDSNGMRVTELISSPLLTI